MIISRRFVLAAPVLLAGCQFLPPMPDETGAPVGLVEGFAGRAAGSGVFTRKHGRGEEHFTLAQNGRLQRGQLVVHQVFAFANGLRNRLTWQFEPEAPGLWLGRRDDLIGTARVVERQGMVWFSYTADFARPAGVTRWGFEEVLYRRPDGALVIDGVLSEGSTPALNLRVVLRG